MMLWIGFIDIYEYHRRENFIRTIPFRKNHLIAFNNMNLILSILVFTLQNIRVNSSKINMRCSSFINFTGLRMNKDTPFFNLRVFYTWPIVKYGIPGPYQSRTQNRMVKSCQTSYWAAMSS